MTTFRFGEFTLDMRNRRLMLGARPVTLNARYLDALALLVCDAGMLVTKDRFLDQVWRGVPVTDEALTQCIRTLRRALGDDAASPRFIETVPKHGYRFIAVVELGDDAETVIAVPNRAARIVVMAGTLGAGFAGVIGGLIYGVAASGMSTLPGNGVLSAIFALSSVAIILALLGGIGVSLGIAAAARMSGNIWRWSVVGGAVGGMGVGAAVKTAGLEAFDMLFGGAPVAITGAGEGLGVGAAVGLAGWLAARSAAGSLWRAVAIATATGATAGLAIAMLGGRLLAGSLHSLAQHFPEGRLRLDSVGRLFGEADFGAASRAVTGAVEIGLFSGCIIGAMLFALREDAARPARPLPRHPAGR